MTRSFVHKIPFDILYDLQPKMFAQVMNFFFNLCLEVKRQESEISNVEPSPTPVSTANASQSLETCLAENTSSKIKVFERRLLIMYSDSYFL